MATPASLPMAGGKVPVFAMVTRSRLSANPPLSWWGRRQSHAKRITSGQLRSQAVCVSEWEAAPQSLHQESEAMS